MENGGRYYKKPNEVKLNEMVEWLNSEDMRSNWLSYNGLARKFDLPPSHVISWLDKQGMILRHNYRIEFR
jgi:hypothetical protein